MHHVRYNPYAWALVALVLYAAIEALQWVPTDVLFSDSISWIQFFEIPIARFYPIVALAPIAILRHAGALPYLYILLAIGAIIAAARNTDTHVSPAARTAYVALTLIASVLGLWSAGTMTSFSASIAYHNLGIIAEVAILLYLSFLAGDLVLKGARIVLLETRIRWVYALMLGLGVFAIVGVILGLAGLFTAFSLRLFMLAVLVSGWQTARVHFRSMASFVRSPRVVTERVAAMLQPHSFFKIFILLWLAINFTFAFAPITAHDTKAYHLPVILDLQQNGRLSFSRNVFEYGWAALTGDTLYAIPTTAFGETTAPFAFPLIQYLMLPLLLLVVNEFLRNRVRHSVARIAGLIFILGIFDLQREALHGGYTDMFAYLFGITSTLLVVDVRWRDRASLQNIKLSALFLGLALAVKLTAGFGAVVTGAYMIVSMIRDRLSFKKAVAYLALYGLTVFAIAGFWYVKNAIVWGNPFYIGGLPLTETLVAERTLGNVLIFPFLKFGAIGHGDSSSELVVAGYFALAYAAALLGILFARKRIDLTHVFLFTFTQAQMMLIFFRTHHTRYMLAAVIMLAPLLALIADEVYERLNEMTGQALRKRIVQTSHILLAIIFLVLFVGDIRYFYVRVLYKTGVLTEQEYIKKIGSQ